jgi:hypothetical protein
MKEGTETLAGVDTIWGSRWLGFNLADTQDRCNEIVRRHLGTISTHRESIIANEGSATFVNHYLQYELHRGSGLAPKTPVGFIGEGGFLAINWAEGQDSAYYLQDDHLLLGTTDIMLAYTVPSLSAIYEAHRHGGGHVKNELFSPVLLLQSPQWLRREPDTGRYTSAQDMSGYTVCVPTIYNMLGLAAVTLPDEAATYTAQRMFAA